VWKKYRAMFNILEIGSEKKVKYMRSIVTVGLPLISLRKRYKNHFEEYQDQ
jgi:hypothetical protein